MQEEEKEEVILCFISKLHQLLLGASKRRRG